jgi:adenosylcobinamide-GDP ribazoletransferase
MIKGWLIDFGLAWRLLTLIPLPLVPMETGRPAGQSAGYYPLVGLILGLLLAYFDWFCAWLLPPGLASALLLVVWVALTGMLHLDGFMDACDGLLPPREPARRLEIMKDSQVGAFGVIGAILLLLLKFNALVAVPVSLRWASLVTVPVLARWAMTWSMKGYPLARKEGLSVFFVQGLGWLQVGLASLVAGSAALLALGWFGLLLWASAWLVTTLLARFSLSRIGGLTGDVYGTICEVVEMALLVVVVGISGLFEV